MTDALNEQTKSCRANHTVCQCTLATSDVKVRFKLSPELGRVQFPNVLNVLGSGPVRAFGNWKVLQDNPPPFLSSKFYAISVPRIPLSLILVPFNTIFMTYCPNINGTSRCHCSKCQCLNSLRVLGPTVGGFHRDGPGRYYLPP